MVDFRSSGSLAVGILALGLLASGCSRAAEAPPVASSASSAAQAPAAGGDLLALVPTPVNNLSTYGPDPLANSGIHQKFEVNGVPTEVMGTYKTALEGNGWQVSTVTSSSDGDGGGATLTGTRGEVYGVFDGGGYQSTTYIEVCLWPTKPADPSCQHGGGR